MWLTELHGENKSQSFVTKRNHDVTADAKQHGVS
jgi:hypothetical protein